MKNSIRKTFQARWVLPAAFLFILLFIALLGWDAFSSNRELLSSEKQLDQTHQTLADLESLNAGLQEARSTQLHYLVTADKQDSEKFQSASAQVLSRLARINAQTHDDKSQQEKVSQLGNLVREELQEENESFSSNRRYLKAQNAAAVRSEQILKLTQQLRSEGQRKVDEQSAAAWKHTGAMRLSLALRITAFSIVMALLFMVVIRESKMLRQAEKSAVEAQSKLKTSLQQLQTESQNSKLLNELHANLQICISSQEAYEVVQAYLKQLLPEASGAIITINNSRNIMELVSAWGKRASDVKPTFSPDECCAMRGGRMHSRLPSSQNLSCQHFTHDAPGAYACLPLVALGDAVGVLHISAADGKTIGASRLAALQQFAEQAAMAFANLKLREKLENQSVRDPLTGLFNRRFLEVTLEREVQRSVRKQSGVGVIMLDIDRFKQFNDTFGHGPGDSVLKQIGSFLRRSVRSEDVVCRYGGEEFVLILPDCTPEGIKERAEFLRSNMANLQLEHNNHSLGQVTASFGVAFGLGGSLTPEVLLRSSDEALFKAKRRGRNRVVLGEINTILPKQILAEKDEKPSSPVKEAPAEAALKTTATQTSNKTTTTSPAKSAVATPQDLESEKMPPPKSRLRVVARNSA